jgi:hypothetical protein
MGGSHRDAVRGCDGFDAGQERPLLDIARLDLLAKRGRNNLVGVRRRRRHRRHCTVPAM